MNTASGSILNVFNREQQEEMHAPEGIFRFCRLSPLQAKPCSPEAIPPPSSSTPRPPPASRLCFVCPDTRSRSIPPALLLARSTGDLPCAGIQPFQSSTSCPRGPVDFTPLSQLLRYARDPSLLPFWHRFWGTNVAFSPLLPSITPQVAALLTTTQDAFNSYSLTRAIVLSLEGFTVLP